MHTNLLETLAAVAEAGSIAGAARKLNVSAAAIAERLKLLEHELDAKLIGRAGRTISLTHAGSVVVPHIKQIIVLLRGLKHLAHPDEISGLITMGAQNSELISIVPGALREISRKYPKLELRIVPGSSDALFDRVYSNDIDCAVCTQPPRSMSKRLSWEPIRSEPLVLLSSFADHGLSPREILETRPFIRADPINWTGYLVDRYLRDNSIVVKDIFCLDALETIRLLVAERIGVSILPDWGIQSGPQSGINKVNLNAKAYDRLVGMLSPPISNQRPVVDILLRELRNQSPRN